MIENTTITPIKNFTSCLEKELISIYILPRVQDPKRSHFWWQIQGKAYPGSYSDPPIVLEVENCG